MKKTDVVYILRNGIAENIEELRYSLRSVVRNWPYRKVWFIGGNPGELTPDGAIFHTQAGTTRYERVRSSMEVIARTEDITDNFYLFNDDFFIMRPVADWKTKTWGTIAEHAERCNGSSYGKEIEYTGALLRQYGHTTKNYALHVPMLVNKERALKVYHTFPSSSMFKDLYGNYWKLESVEQRDAKVQGLHEYPLPTDTISTNESTFAHGYVGQIIKQMFPEPTKYERG